MQWLTYEEVLLRAQNFGSGLISMGLQPGVHTKVGIYSRGTVLRSPNLLLTQQGGDQLQVHHSDCLLQVYTVMEIFSRFYLVGIYFRYSPVGIYSLHYMLGIYSRYTMMEIFAIGTPGWRFTPYPPRKGVLHVDYLLKVHHVHHYGELLYKLNCGNLICYTMVGRDLPLAPLIRFFLLQNSTYSTYYICLGTAPSGWSVSRACTATLWCLCPCMTPWVRRLEHFSSNNVICG